MGITLDELVFDPANPDNGANVGATLRGADGTVIGNVADALKVTGDFTIANAEVEISNDAGNPIPVSATDLDIRDLAFATDKVDVTGSEVSLDAATLAALEEITVVATDLDIRDLQFGTDSVDVSGSEVKQDSYDSLKNSAQTITSTASALAGTPLANRVNMLIQNLGNQDIWIGSNNAVTSANGVKIPKGASAEFKFSALATPHAITQSGSADVRILEMAY